MIVISMIVNTTKCNIINIVESLIIMMVESDFFLLAI
jgi:hypothetical protein